MPAWPTSRSACRAWVGAISLAGSPEQKSRWLPRVARGEAIAAFALSEPDAGCDVAALQCAARIDGDHAVLDGEKTWISNGGIADFYVVFARSGEARARAGFRPSSSKPAHPDLEIAERIDVIAPHPLARLRFTNCRVPLANRVGAGGEGFKIAMRTLDVFRTSVAAAALGFARRALEEGLQRATTRKMFGQTLADFQLTQAKLAQMATTIDGAALLTYRAAWQRDQGDKVTAQAAMAKLAATEGAQQVIDAAVQLFGGLGVVSGHPVERLYREIRSLRIYEGATEVQQLIIGRELLKGPGHEPPGRSQGECRSAQHGGCLMTHQLLQPAHWARPKGYANGVAVTLARGRQVFVAGMIGWDAQGQFHSDDLVAQVRQALPTRSRYWPRPAPGPSTSCA